jgi:hypothetical protein
MQAIPVPSIWRTIGRRRPLIMSVVVLGWSTKYFVSLALTHNTGPELYGVLTAALAIGAAIANFALLRTPRVLVVVTAGVLVLWAVIAVAGLGGTVAHIVGPVAGHGPIDPRPRPVPAPLVFTLLGSVGAFALASGQRARLRAALASGKA